jgi:hypothetical protein
MTAQSASISAHTGLALYLLAVTGASHDRHSTEPAGRARAVTRLSRAERARGAGRNIWLRIALHVTKGGR